MSKVDPNELVPAAFAHDEFEAHTKATVLKSEGIDAFVFAAERMWLGIGLPQGVDARGVPVMVRRQDAEQARVLLEKKIADSVDLDWEEVDLGEREDALPLHPVDHGPLAARVAMALVAAILVLGALTVILGMLF